MLGNIASINVFRADLLSGKISLILIPLYAEYHIKSDFVIPKRINLSYREHPARALVLMLISDDDGGGHSRAPMVEHHAFIVIYSLAFTINVRWFYVFVMVVSTFVACEAGMIMSVISFIPKHSGM